MMDIIAEIEVLKEELANLRKEAALFAYDRDQLRVENAKLRDDLTAAYLDRKVTSVMNTTFDGIESSEAIKPTYEELEAQIAALQESNDNWMEGYNQAQAKLQETCLQVAGAVWATAAPDKEMDAQACIDIVKAVMQEQT